MAININHVTEDISTTSGAAPTLGGKNLSFTPNDNTIINGDLNSWQEGTSFTSIAANTYFADLWNYKKSGVAVHDVTRDTDVPSVAQSGHFSNYSIKVDCTTIDSSIAAADSYLIQYVIEGFDFQRIAQQQFTISFWHKHTKTGTYCVSFRNTAADRSYVAEYTQDASEVWEYATITVSASPSAGTWNYGNGAGLIIGFAIAIGSNFHGTANTWNSANDTATANQVNACDSISNNFKLAQIKIEPGAIATPFIGRSIQEELNRIARYFWRENNAGDIQASIASGVYNSTTNAYLLWKFHTPMRAAPTLGLSNVADFRVYSSLFQDVTGLTTLTTGSVNSMILNATTAAVTDGDGAVLIFDQTAGRYIERDARL